MSKQLQAVKLLKTAMDKHTVAVLHNLPVPELTEEDNYNLSQKLGLISGILEGIDVIVQEKT